MKTAKQNSSEALPCAMHTTMGVLGGKWKFVILYSLLDGKPKRFKQLERGIAGIAARMLIKELKSLESEGLVQRTAYATVPPTVEYQLTKYGKTLAPVIRDLEAWGKKHKAKSAPSAKK
jgi:DNA-binding HxlR family transcriptional regulator